jgi:hypothetical protein
MKKILFLFAVVTALTSNSQIQWDYLGGLPINMHSTVDACMFFDFEQNGSNEVKIVHGDDAGCYMTSCTGIPIYAPTHNINGVDLWSDCDHNNFFNWPSDTAWILKGNTRLTSGSHVLPFKYDGKVGYFVLKITSGSDTLKVRGYKFQIPTRDFECYDLVPPRTLIRTLENNSLLYKDYNILGFEVDEYYTGFTFRVYEDGTRETIYK